MDTTINCANNKSKNTPTKHTKNKEETQKTNKNVSSKSSKKNIPKKDIIKNKRELAYDESSSDDDFIPPDSDDYDTEQEENDKREYKKLLSKIFTQGDKHINESDCDEDTSEFSDEEYNSKSTNFTILLTVDKPNLSYDSSDEESSHIDEQYPEEGYDEQESEEEEIIRDVKKEVKRSKYYKKVEKPKAKANSSPEYDERTINGFKEMMSSIKNKGASSDVLSTFEKLITEEETKLKEINIKATNKIKSKNSKLFNKMLREKSTSGVTKYFKTLEINQQETLMEQMAEINKHTQIVKPYKLTLIESNIPIIYKASAMQKINALDYMDPGSGEYYKIKQWVDTFMKIPFDVYSTLPVNMSDGIDKCDAFMTNARDILNDAVYGMDDAKLQILQMMGQWISNPTSIGSAIAIKGPMGTGKTTLVKEGVSRILNRPFEFIALGGATDSSFLEGHSYTYEGSIWGKIVDILIKSKCMNPIIYFDELDKVSDTPKGEEIIGILTHLTDTTQNSKFHDKYFSDIDFDLSKVLFIFSYNDDDKVNPILRDRMYRIQTDGYNGKEKMVISHDYLMPSIERNVNFAKGDIIITDAAIDYIVREYTGEEKGVRNLKRCIEIIYTKLNMFRLMKPETKLFKNTETFELTFPFYVTVDIVQKLVKKTTKPRYTSMYI